MLSAGTAHASEANILLAAMTMATASGVSAAWDAGAPLVYSIQMYKLDATEQ